MSEWKKVKIGDIFSIEKGSLQSSKCTPGEYDFITAATDWKTHNSFDHECEAIVYAVAASGSLGRAHYVNGKFIASDLCFILTEKDKNQYPINFLFYQIVFEMLRDEIVSKTKTGTSKESINRGNFSNYEIPYFPIEFQLANYQKFVDAKNTIKNLLEEAEVQKKYIKQLRQNILQEAIEGKLTADWRKQNPVQKGNPDYDAEALFEQIQKERNIEKKQKALPPIKDEEKPFELPEGWKWVRLGEVCNIIGGYAFSSLDLKPFGDNYILRLGNIRDDQIRYEAKPAFVSTEITEDLDEYKAKLNDILLTMTGTRGKHDYLYSVIIRQEHLNTYQMFVNQRICIIRPKLYPEFIYKSLHSSILKDPIFGSATGSANQANVGIKTLNDWFIPFPPLKEQEEIVNKVETLLAKVTTLENQIQDRKTLSDKLIFGIIKENLEEK